MPYLLERDRNRPKKKRHKDKKEGSTQKIETKKLCYYPAQTGPPKIAIARPPLDFSGGIATPLS